ncbi:MAG: hypothetical protein AB8B87_10890 [Granulosicoccus sp.]
MPLKSYGVVAVASLLDASLLLDLLTGLAIVESAAVWMFLHVMFVIAGAMWSAQLLLENAEQVAREHPDGQTHFSEANAIYPLSAFITLCGICIPGVGLAGITIALAYGLRASMSRSYTPDYWTITPLAELPYVAPLGRQLKPVDSRGFTEHLLYSTDDQDIYHKVLASANVKTSLAVDTLKQAMQHRDEKVRLTAYKTLDRKVTTLNKRIQHLENELDSAQEESSDKWLQIASNYWELVTLEGTEVVARKQLLSKAASAAIKAVSKLPGNRDAHLVLGRVSLAQGDTRRASVALERAQALGMPADKVLPYLAECAYLDKNLPRVQRILAGLDSSIVAYPPLSHVARYWA